MNELHSPSFVWLRITVRKLCNIQCCKIFERFVLPYEKMLFLFSTPTEHNIVTSVWRNFHADIFANSSESNLLNFTVIVVIIHVEERTADMCQFATESNQLGLSFWKRVRKWLEAGRGHVEHLYFSSSENDTVNTVVEAILITPKLWGCHN